MNSNFEKLYFMMPFWLQNILVSIYGLKLRKERYSVDHDLKLSQLMKSAKFSEDEIKRYQEEQFVALARYAVTNVPYYREIAQRNGFDENDINSIDDLIRFPILKKSTVKESPENFVSDEYDVEKLISLYTSGTSGTPLKVYCNKSVRSQHYAFFTRLRRSLGIDEKGIRVTLFGRIIMRPNEVRPPFWRWDFFNRNLLMSSYHLSENNIIEYYNKIKQVAPSEIIGYPSSIYQISKYIVNNSLDKLKVKAVITTAETLMDYQRKSIEEAFDAPVINQYGCTEMAFFVSECEHGSLHINPEHGIMEIIRSEEILKNKGPIAVTGLINNVMPLIRYEVGDIVEFSEKKECQCGSKFPIISRVEGRVDDIVFSKSGAAVGRLDPVFKGGQNISEAQIHQLANGNIIVRVVPTELFSDENAEWIKYELKKRVGDGLNIDIQIVHSIELEKSGKFKSVISEYKPHRSS